jgi:catechol 2,3-dioxygenase-like lactoylglutathione lyase family enzyme
MLSHVYVGVTDFQRALAFYSAVMDTLGFPLRFDRQQPTVSGGKRVQHIAIFAHSAAKITMLTHRKLLQSKAIAIDNDPFAEVHGQALENSSLACCRDAGN